jgi:hypothetical protein
LVRRGCHPRPRGPASAGEMGLRDRLRPLQRSHRSGIRPSSRAPTQGSARSQEVQENAERRDAASTIGYSPRGFHIQRSLLAEELVGRRCAAPVAARPRRGAPETGSATSRLVQRGRAGLRWDFDTAYRCGMWRALSLYRGSGVAGCVDGVPPAVRVRAVSCVRPDLSMLGAPASSHDISTFW